MLHQMTTIWLHTNLYLLYVIGVPTLLGVVVGGGVRRTFQGRPAYYWMAFAMFVAVGLPFSSYKSHSLGQFFIYLRTNLPMLFVAGGLIVTWRECRAVMYAIAASAVVNMASSKIFETDAGGRLSLEGLSIANSNDFAGHLLLVLPFLLWVALGAKSIFLRMAALGGIAWDLLLILKTASRGGLVGLIVGTLCFLFWGTNRQRIAALCIAPIAAAILVSMVPDMAMQRILSFSAAAADASAEALESQNSRRYLLEQSIRYTLRFPIFGVGLDEFSDYEGAHNQVLGTHGLYHESHNTWTQVSSECGVLALALFVAGVVSSILLLYSTHRKARERPDCTDIRLVAFCLLIATISFCSAITFLSFAYFFYWPALSGLAIAVHRAAEREFLARSQAGEPALAGVRP